jgi:hypothetical protein
VLAVVDSTAGQTTLLAELPHGIAIAGSLLLYRLARTDKRVRLGENASYRLASVPIVVRIARSMGYWQRRRRKLR